jgi:hypothetical protein
MALTSVQCRCLMVVAHGMNLIYLYVDLWLVSKMLLANGKRQIMERPSPQILDCLLNSSEKG